MKLVWKTIHITLHNINSLRHDTRIKATPFNFLNMEIIISIYLASNAFNAMIITHKHVQKCKHHHHKWTIPIRTYFKSNYHKIKGNRAAYHHSILNTSTQFHTIQFNTTRPLPMDMNINSI